MISFDIVIICSHNEFVEMRCKVNLLSTRYKTKGECQIEITCVVIDIQFEIA